MIIDILQKFPDLIQEYDIYKFRIVGNAYEMVLQIKLVGGTSLHIRDYMFSDGSRNTHFIGRTTSINANCVGITLRIIKTLILFHFTSIAEKMKLLKIARL